MFTYQLSEPRRPIALALQATFIHASLIAGAVVASRSTPLILHHTDMEVPVTWPVSHAPRMRVVCECGLTVPTGVAVVTSFPEIPQVPTLGGQTPIDPKGLIDEHAVLFPSGSLADTMWTTTILDESMVDDSPTLVAAGMLRYPEILDAARIEGSVTLRFVIDTAGGVEPDGITLIAATNAGFVPAAKEAVLTSRFRPAVKAHHPVRVRVQQTITFKR
jgi:TonB family protein